MIFDMDGVVLDSMDLWRGMMPALSKEIGVEIDRETASRVQVMSIELCSQFLVDNYDIDMTADEIADLIQKRITTYYTVNAKLKPGVYDLMPILRMNRINVCLATATPKVLARKALNRCDIAEYFVKIFTVSDFGRGKESPDIFEAALAYLGTKPEETLVIEDSEVAIRTAHDMGMKTCAVYDGVNDSVLDTVADITDVKITNLGELIDIVTD